MLFTRWCTVISFVVESDCIAIGGGGMVVNCNVGFVVGFAVGMWLRMVGGTVGFWVGSSSITAGAPSFCEALCIGLAYCWVHVGGPVASGIEVGR